MDHGRRDEGVQERKKLNWLDIGQAAAKATIMAAMRGVKQT